MEAYTEVIQMHENVHVSQKRGEEEETNQKKGRQHLSCELKMERWGRESELQKKKKKEKMDRKKEQKKRKICLPLQQPSPSDGGVDHGSFSSGSPIAVSTTSLHPVNT